MTPQQDDLHRLWNLDTGHPLCSTLELVREIEQAAVRFDRTIRFRNLREISGGLLVTAIFLWLALHDLTWPECLAHLWLACCGLWIAFYLRRFFATSRPPLQVQALSDYQRELVGQYDRQVGLLKSARYWYLLPFWAGLMGSAAATWLRNRNGWQFVLVAITVTAMNAILWWLNEGPGVRYLEDSRRQLLARTGIDTALQ